MEWVIVVGIIIAAICGIVIARDANSRGMGQLWGVFVFLFCGLGLPLYLIVRKPYLIQQAQPQQGATLENGALPGPKKHKGLPKGCSIAIWIVVGFIVFIMLIGIITYKQ